MEPKGRAFLAYSLVAVLALAGQAVAGYVYFGADGNQDIGDPLNDPNLPGSVTYTPAWAMDGETVQMYEIIAGGSDWWDNGEFGHVAYEQDISGDFRLVANVAMEDLTAAEHGPGGVDNWMKAGVFARKDLLTGPVEKKSTNAIAAATWGNNGTFQYRPDDTSGMSNIGAGSMRPWAVSLEREGNVFTGSIYEPQYGSGGTWIEVATWDDTAGNMGSDPFIGLFVTAHKNERREKGYFWDVQITTDLADAMPEPVWLPTLQGDRPRSPGTPVNDPERVDSQNGGWGVVEVMNNGNMGNVRDAIKSLENGGGVRHEYQLMGPINIRDPNNGNSKNFGNDGPYGMPYSAVGNPGDLNHLAFLARGTIRIPAGKGGDWTFLINSDDGEEMTIYNIGETTPLLVIGSEGWTDNNMGTVNLPAGDYDVQVVHREATGGGDVEVAAARGNTDDLEVFNLIGGGDPGQIGGDSIVPGVANLTLTQTLPSAYGQITNLTQAQLALGTAIAEGKIYQIGDTVVNHSDPNGPGSGGQFGGEHNNPYDVVGPGATTADDDSVIHAHGLLDIPQDDTYYIGYNSDDGAGLQIVGGQWLSIVDGSHGDAEIVTTDTADDTLATDALTGWSWTVGEIFLTAGAHEFNLLMFERGGGFFVEMFGGTIPGYYGLIEGSGDVITVKHIEPSLELVIPEPATLTLLALGGLAVCIRRRRK